jgi:hypothetical protein
MVIACSPSLPFDKVRSSGGLPPKRYESISIFANTRWLKRAVEAGVEAVRSGEPCSVCHLVVLARSSRGAVSPQREYPRTRARTLRPAKDRLEIFDSFQLLFAYGRLLN